MKKCAYKILGILLCLIYSIPPLAYSDRVYLKNKDTNIEGIIEKEDEKTVVLNIGYGTITFNKSELKYIQRYASNEQDELRERWKYKYFMRPEFIPDNLKDVARDFKELETIRNIAVQNKREGDKAVRQIEGLDNELKELNANLSILSDKLSATKPEDGLEKYNALVSDFNSSVAKIKSAEYSKAEFQKELGLLDKKVFGYINDFRMFRNSFLERHNLADEKTRLQNRHFFEGVKKELNLMEKDFTKHIIDFNKDGLGIIVEAVLEKKVKASLIVDTGASLTVISKEVADRLGLNLTDKESTIAVTLADGSRIKAYPMILASVKVADLEVKNVKAAVLQNSQDTPEDGLLGMSFLENFVIRIDAKSNKLILEEFNPS